MPAARKRFAAERTPLAAILQTFGHAIERQGCRVAEVEHGADRVGHGNGLTFVDEAGDRPAEVHGAREKTKIVRRHLHADDAGALRLAARARADPAKGTRAQALRDEQAAAVRVLAHGGLGRGAGYLRVQEKGVQDHDEDCELHGASVSVRHGETRVAGF